MFANSIKALVKYPLLLFVDVALFLMAGPAVGGIEMPSFVAAFSIVLALSIINALLWPVLARVSLSFLVLTLGFGTFIIDGILLGLIGLFVPEVSVEGFALFIMPLLFAVINSFVSIILDIHTDTTFYGGILKKRLQKDSKTRDKDGYIFLEIDGLSRKILEEALSKDKMPTLKRWLDEGSHKLASWQTDLSSQTGSSQAGILHGNNGNIPAFRWVEKENGNKVVSSNGFADSRLLEKRISDGNGLLSDNGASRSNLFSGDAEDYILTFSKFASKKSIATRTWYSLYSNPYFITRMLVLFFGDMLLESCSRIRQYAKNVKPRLNRNLSYFAARAGANVAIREATTLSIIGDIYVGRYNAVYATYMGYDEIAHHSGIRDKDSFHALEHIDRQFKQLEKAVADSGNNYHLTVLSDHGQSGGPTFKQKYGCTLEDLVKENLPGNITVHSILHSNDDHFFESAGFEKDNGKIDSVIDKITSSMEKNRDRLKNIRDKNILDGGKPVFDTLKQLAREFANEDNIPDDVLVSDKPAQTIVLASGNLGLIYFTDWSSRLAYEQIEDAFPNLINSLKRHPGIGFVMVKSALYGSIVLNGDDVYYIDEDRYEGARFLDAFGKNIAEGLRRTDSFEHVPDILVNSAYDAANDEVYAFEELIGSHGGAGGGQQHPFILYPGSWDLDGEIVGAENVYKFFKKQMGK